MTDETVGMEDAIEETTQSRRPRKLAKSWKNDGAIFEVEVLDSNTGPMEFDPEDLPEEIKSAIFRHGLSQKLGDAAAGKSSDEAVEAVNKVWEGLVNGDFNVKVSSRDRLSRSSLFEKINNMDPEEQEKAKQIVERLLAQF